MSRKTATFASYMLLVRHSLKVAENCSHELVRCCLLHTLRLCELGVTCFAQLVLLA